MVEELCHECGAEIESYDVIDPESGETVGEEIACPNQWREGHQ
jgi:DNA-directed RNA polymerase subunit RPC12/RpoP